MYMDCLSENLVPPYIHPPKSSPRLCSHGPDILWQQEFRLEAAPNKGVTDLHGYILSNKYISLFFPVLAKLRISIDMIIVTIS